MAVNIYKWRGFKYKIADEDLEHYPGAELVKPKKKAEEKKTEEKKTDKPGSPTKPAIKKKVPANKARKAANK